MNLLVSSIPIPKIQFQYIKGDGEKLFRIVSESVDPLFEQLLLGKSIRVQVWLEREVRKQSGEIIKRSWVHSVDMSNKKPPRLFTDDEYNYGGGEGWGWKEDIPSYTTTNGIVPTEFEVTYSSLSNGKIKVVFPVLDIFSNILKTVNSGPAKDGDSIEKIAIVSRGRATYQLLRARLVINHNGKVIMGDPTDPIMLGIHKNNKVTQFDSSQLNKLIKVGRYI